MNTVLGAAGLVDANHAWSGGARTLIITGDVIDKGDYSLPVLDIITLTSEAELAGGRVVVTLGNHEAEFLADPENAKATPFRADLGARLESGGRREGHLRLRRLLAHPPDRSARGRMVLRARRQCRRLERAKHRRPIHAALRRRELRQW